MKAIKFDGVNVMIAEDQEEYQTLPAHVSKDGTITTCFQLSDEELEELKNNGGRIYYQQVTHGRPMSPMMLSTSNLMVPIDKVEEVIPVKRPENEFAVEKDPTGRYVLVYCGNIVFTSKLKRQRGVQECKIMMRDLIKKSNES